MKDILEICDFYLDTQIWTIEPSLNPTEWLSNFTEDELPYAEELLASFLYFNNKMSVSFLKAGFQKVCRELYATKGIETQEELLDKTIFSTIDIDESNITASGYNVCRMAKLNLSIPEKKFFNKVDALNYLNNGNCEVIIFLDDFIGSGLQFTNSWTDTEFVNGSPMSYAGVCRSKNISAFYIPLVATTYGLREIDKTCKDVNIIPSNILDETYSALSDKSFIWSEHLKSGAINFLEQASIRAGIKDWKGFHDLALTIAFTHSIPDATLPLFYWNKNGWKPLITNI